MSSVSCCVIIIIHVHVNHLSCCTTVHQENDRKIFLMEEKVREEKERASREKKEFNEQLKSYRNETKALTEKILK